MATELLLVTNTPGLVEALGGYNGILPFPAPNLARVRSLIASDQPPPVIYLEDTRGTIADLWETIHVAQARGVRVLIGIQNIGVVHAGDFTDAGLAITTARDADALAAWIAQQLGVARRLAARQVTIAVAGAKGGIGKSLVVASLAEGMRRRGLRVLVVDGDLSNSGLVPEFRIPAGFGSFLTLRQEGRGHSQFTPTNVARLIWRHAPSGIDFLLGADEAALAADFTLPDWRALMQAVGSLGEVLERDYDVVLIDTGPDMKKRPYALEAARNGGWVVLPAPPGRKERAGVGIALQQFAAHQPDLTDRCLLILMEPERGVTIGLRQVAPLFNEHWPKARIIGTLPRDPHLVSLANEEADRYVSPLDVGKFRPFSLAVHAIVDEMCRVIGLPLPQPKPTVSLFRRWFPGKPALQVEGGF
ncbi:AAA family ATPase [Roseiflexus castenholzii]|uniref:nucleotide-binding protein n=1 Tax=Roseiflexus castenholzii TaxID=120962 RepID=UPI003C7DD5E9